MSLGGELTTDTSSVPTMQGAQDVLENFFKIKVSIGVATVREISERAKPTVFCPISSPKSRRLGAKISEKSISLRTVMCDVTFRALKFG